MNLILETERLWLKPLELSHTAEFFKMDSNPKVHEYLWQKPVETVDETIKIIENVLTQYKNNDIGRFAIYLKETNEFVGWCGLKFNTDVVNNKTNFYDIGYRLAEKFWNNGYASEAASEWLRYGFEELKLEKIVAAAHVDNNASNRILQKIGLQFTEVYFEEETAWNWYELNNT